ncbi:hypothetical protein [Bradyrhizobium sp.]|jgi:hypothetical protein|uniref:hypothetical protein n=1 Tax=Bradyrhizobium sp. TaxID=376 RepID=UPI003C787EFF
MSVSSIAASSPVKAPEVIETRTPDARTDGNADDASASQPTVLAPLPPGQGMRIDQLV